MNSSGMIPVSDKRYRGDNTNEPPAETVACGKVLAAGDPDSPVPGLANGRAGAGIDQSGQPTKYASNNRFGVRFDSPAL